MRRDRWVGWIVGIDAGEHMESDSEYGWLSMSDSPSPYSLMSSYAPFISLRSSSSMESSSSWMSSSSYGS